MDGELWRTVSAALVTASSAAGIVLILVAVRGGPRRTLVPRLAAVVLLVSAALPAVSAVAGTDLSVVGTAFFPAFALFAATFPDGRFAPRPAWVIVAVLAVVVTVDALLGGALTALPLWWLVPTTSGALLVGAQVWRYRRSATTREREQVRWVLLGVLVSMACYSVLVVVDDGVAGTGAASEARANLAGLPIVIGLVVGMTRPRLANVDALLRAVLVAWFAALGLVPVFWTAWMLTDALGGDTVAAGWWWALAVAVAAYPIVRFAVRLADLVVHRGRPSPEAAVTLFGSRLAAGAEPGGVPEVVVAVVEASTGCHDVRLEADGAGIPIEYQGELLGVLVVPPRAGESELTRRDLATVRAIALHAGPALSAARAAGELSIAHSRLVSAHEEERRRLRRDLHDDLSPTLSGIALAAAALSRSLAPTDPGASEQARDLHGDVQAAVAQSRELAYGLRPAVLDDLGLVAAIRDRVLATDTASTLHVDVVDAGVPIDLPAAVDVAALRIVQEAVANVRRHANATRCRVELSTDGIALRLSVADDGAGLPARVRPGIGLTSIRERAQELGGTAMFGPGRDGGTLVAVRLPLTAEHG